MLLAETHNMVKFVMSVARGPTVSALLHLRFKAA